MAQYPAGKPPERRRHNGQDGGLDAKEYRRHRHRLLIRDIKHAERKDDQRPGQDEQHPGDHTAPHPVEQPSEIDGELLRFGPGKQHAEIQRMQEPLLADPFQLLDEQAVHYGDLPGRATKAEKADFQPDEKGLIETDMYGITRLCVLSGLILHRRPARYCMRRQYGRGASD